MATMSIRSFSTQVCFTRRKFPIEGDARRYKIWTKKALVPCWLTQNIWLVAILIVEIIYEPSGTLFNSSLTLISCITCCIIFNIGEIGVFALGRLKPFAYLWYQVVKATIWLVLSVIALQSIWTEVNAGQHTALILPVVGTLIPLLTLATCIAPLVYGGVVYHSQRKRNAFAVRQSLDGEETLYPGAHNEGTSLVETYSAPSILGGSVGNIHECDGAPVSVQIFKSQEEVRDVSSAYEMAPEDTKGGLGFGLSTSAHDDCGPYELPDRRSMRSIRSSAI